MIRTDSEHFYAGPKDLSRITLDCHHDDLLALYHMLCKINGLGEDEFTDEELCIADKLISEVDFELGYYR